MVTKPLVNRVANSGLITINLEDYYPSAALRSIDLKDFLFQGLILREKDFRAAIAAIDWTDYTDHILSIHCSAEAIIPTWAYMLIASKAAEFVSALFVCTPEETLNHYYKSFIDRKNWEEFAEAKVVIKGCSNKKVPDAAYAYLTQKLQPIAKSIMFGEPCSTVPIFKQPRDVKKSRNA